MEIKCRRVLQIRAVRRYRTSYVPSVQWPTYNVPSIDPLLTGNVPVPYGCYSSCDSPVHDLGYTWMHECLM